MLGEDLKRNNFLIYIIDPIENHIFNGSLNLSDYGIEQRLFDTCEMAFESIKDDIPGMIIIDYQYYTSQNSQFCDLLRNSPETKNIPIIFTSENANTENVINSFEIGGSDYLLKPVSSAIILAKVKTHLKLNRYRDEINSKNLELEKLNNEKNEIIGMTAHDLKNPIFNISMLAKVIKNDMDLSRDEEEEFCQDIIESADRMLELIANLLDLNKIEQGQFVPEYSEIDVVPLIKNVIYGFSDWTNGKNITIDQHLKDGCLIESDQNAVIQIIDNILSNAIKYSPVGKTVSVSTYCLDNYFHAEISDQGPGISPEDQKKLFKKFARLSAKPTANENSTGLGLSIARKYADIINAEIICRSAIGTGTSFVIKFPVKQPA